MKLDDLFQENRFRAGDVADRLAGHGVGQKADEVTRVPGFQRHPDFTVGLEAADARTVTGARIDDDEGSLRRINLDAGRRNDTRQTIIDRPFEPPAVDDQLGLIIEHMRRGLGQVLAILIAALAHDIPEQDAALPRIDQVFERRRKQIRKSRHFGRFPRLDGVALGHLLFLLPITTAGWLALLRPPFLLPITFALCFGINAERQNEIQSGMIGQLKSRF